MMIIAATLVYCIYIVVVFSYIADILQSSTIKPITYTLLIIANSFLLIIPIYLTDFRHEILIMALYLVFFSVETKVICKSNIFQTLFGVFSFSINFFALRTIIIVVMSFISGEMVVSIISSEENRILITLINMIIPIPYILLTRMIMKNKILGIALSDRSTSILSTVFLGAIFINQMAAYPSLYKVEGDLVRNLYYHLTVSIFSIAIFMLVMIINLVYSNLKIVADNYTQKASELKAQDVIIKDIEERSVKDAMTGFYLRDTAIKRIEKYLEQTTEFFIVFIDIDGLKTVNDNFGHNEGDRYIKMVANKIEKNQGDHLIARIGGDEFLVIGQSSDNKDIAKTIKATEQDIAAMSDDIEKNYQTSISYGIQTVDKNNTLNATELIAMADEKMYELKKSRKKNRD